MHSLIVLILKKYICFLTICPFYNNLFLGKEKKDFQSVIRLADWRKFHSIMTTASCIFPKGQNISIKIALILIAFQLLLKNHNYSALTPTG